MRPSLLLGRRTSGVGIWSGAGSVHHMDISSNTPKVHGRALWANPVTISHFLGVPHYYWGAGRPEWVSGTIPTTAPCSPSGWQFYLYVGYRSTLAQLLNQCRIDWWLNDAFSLNRKHIFYLAVIRTHTNSLWELQGSNRFRSHQRHISTWEVHIPQYDDYSTHPIQIIGSITQITPVRFTYIFGFILLIPIT